MRMQLSESLTGEAHVFISLSQMTRLLKLRRNVVKLSLYQHFINTLIFSVLGEVDFCVWVSVSQYETYCRLYSMFFSVFICAASIIFIIWTTRQFKFVDCLSVSSTFTWLWFYEKQCCVFLLEFLTNIFGLSGLERPVGGWCFLEAALFHHPAGHHGAATTFCQ